MTARGTTPWSPPRLDPPPTRARTPGGRADGSTVDTAPEAVGGNALGMGLLVPERNAQELLQSIFKVATALVRGERASLLLREGTDTHFVIAMAHGIADEVRQHAQIREGEGVAGRVAATKRPVL